MKYSYLAAIELLLSVIFSAAVFAAASAGDVCANELLAISPCLSYIAMEPNNLSSVVDPLCCDPFRAASDGAAHCVCRLLSKPDLLGFPLNLTRLLSLFSFCPASGAMLDADSPQKICRRSQSGPSTERPAGRSGPPRPTEGPADGSTPSSPTESPARPTKSKPTRPTQTPASESGPPELPVQSPVSPTSSSPPPANFSASLQPRSVSSGIPVRPSKLLFSFGFVFSAFT